MTYSTSTQCPVCGYDLGFAPWNSGSPSDEICPSCGIQFGYDDAAGGSPEGRESAYKEWRRKWVSTGMKWASGGRPPPEQWNPHEQLKKLERARDQS